jgi:uncharacterized protein YjbI with pentapeptide repeats
MDFPTNIVFIISVIIITILLIVIPLTVRGPSTPPNGTIVPIVLVPFGVYSNVKITQASVDVLDQGDDDFTNATLHKVNIDDIDLSSVNIRGMRSSQITGEPTALPDGWSIVSGYLIGPGADLSSTNFGTADLSTANLAGIISGNVRGVPKLPTGYVLINGYIVGPQVNLVGAYLNYRNLSGLDLSGIDFSGAHLEGSNLIDTDLTNTIFNETNINNTNFGGSVMTGTIFNNYIGVPSSLPANTFVSNGNIYGPGTNLNGRNFQNFDFSGVDLTGVQFNNTNISGANFEGATLTGTNFVGAITNGSRFVNFTGTPASMPNSWSIVSSSGGSTIIGNNLDDSSVSFTGGNIIGSNISNTNFSNSTFTGTMLSGSSFNSCNFNGTTFTNIDLDGQTLGFYNCSMNNAILNGSINVSQFIFDNCSLIGANIASAGSGIVTDGSNLTNIIIHVTGANVILNNSNLQGSDLGTDTSNTIWGANNTGTIAVKPSNVTYSGGTLTTN